MSPTPNPENRKLKVQPPDTCWLLQPATYRLRQSAELEYQNKKDIFEGFMELNLEQQQAHLIIFTALGVTLLDIEIKSRSFGFAKTLINVTDKKPSPSSREKRFAAAVANAVQHIFLSLKPQPDHNPQIQVRLSGSPPELGKLIKSSPKQTTPDWVVSYHDYHEYPCGRLPQRIILQNYKPAFKLTIWLHKAVIK